MNIIAFDTSMGSPSCVWNNLGTFYLAIVLILGSGLWFVAHCFRDWVQGFAGRCIEKFPSTLQPKDTIRKKNVGLGNQVSNNSAQELDMDFLYLDFFDFLWGYTFIRPFVFFHSIKGITILMLRNLLESYNMIKPAECNYRVLVGKLCLEQMLVIHYTRTTPLDNIAKFEFDNFPYIDDKCEYKSADMFAVDIDLNSKRFVRAKLDGVDLTAKETSIFLWFYLISALHVKIHSLANWSCNTDKSFFDDHSKSRADTLLRRNSIATIMYNHFGYSGFPIALKKMAAYGIVSKEWDPSHWIMVLNAGIKDNIVYHAHVKELFKHSRLVKFVVRARGIFLSEFEKHKTLFPHVNGEALFVGTVVHSLDHTFAEGSWNLTDPLWLDTNDPRCGKMAEIGRVVKVGFMDDLPGLYFHHRFKGSGHPFFETVYQKVAKFDKELADCLDTCIIK